jgi:hypothetical protein
MAGITTSDMLSGEQPKDDGLGSRVDELTVEVGELRKEVTLLRCRVTDQFEAVEKKISVDAFEATSDIVSDMDGLRKDQLMFEALIRKKIDILELKINDEE